MYKKSESPKILEIIEDMIRDSTELLWITRKILWLFWMSIKDILSNK